MNGPCQWRLRAEASCLRGFLNPLGNWFRGGDDPPFPTQRELAEQQLSRSTESYPGSERERSLAYSYDIVSPHSSHLL